MNDPSYSRLQLEPIRGTLGPLGRRVGERFPHSGLHGVAREMVRLGDAIEVEIAELQRPRWWLRTLSVVAVLGVVGVAAWAIRNSVRIAALMFAAGLHLLEARRSCARRTGDERLR